MPAGERSITNTPCSRLPFHSNSTPAWSVARSWVGADAAATVGRTATVKYPAVWLATGLELRTVIRAVATS